MNKQKKSLIRLSILSFIFIVLLLLMVALRQNSKANEFLFNYLSLNIIFVMAKITSLIPISFYELFLYLSGIFIIVSLTLSIVFLARKKRLKALNTFLSLFLTATIVATTYFASAGFAYNKEITNLPFFNDSIPKEKVVEICDYFLSDFNYLAEKLPRDADGNVISPYTDKQLSDKLIQEYKRLDNAYTPSCKTIFSSYIMSQMRIRGVFFAPFGEANINRIIPSCEKPFVMAHEMAHARGVMREDDADLTALYITLTSDDEYIRYSAYMEGAYVLFLSLILMGEYNEYNRIIGLQSPLALFEMQNGYEFWTQFTLLNDIIHKINDLYLKIMGQDEGTDAYVPDTGSSTELPVIDPDTEQPVIDPDTEAPVVTIIPNFSLTQKLFFEVYNKKVNN